MANATPETRVATKPVAAATTTTTASAAASARKKSGAISRANQPAA